LLKFKSISNFVKLKKLPFKILPYLKNFKVIKALPFVLSRKKNLSTVFA